MSALTGTCLQHEAKHRTSLVPATRHSSPLFGLLDDIGMRSTQLDLALMYLLITYSPCEPLSHMVLGT
ncbi:hypothetical protein BDW59DRAFT_166534 [Aspergillus cavernicola]|uniref:Uncharacterized protein n=1 Tax=Aspergillus cavernicola TaxID=176166 RepID=A0ABR4HKR3_9EURO